MNEREYDLMYAVEEQHWWYVALHELVLATLDGEGRRDLTILDAGCGTGRLAQLLSSYGSVVGCDLSERALDYSRRRGIAVFAADLNTVDLGVERFDVITAIDVLYHQAIAEDAPVLAAFYRALKPGGILILNLVAFECLRSTHDLAVHTRKRYTRQDLLPLLQSAGFTVETVSYRLGFLFAPIAGYRWIKRRWQADTPVAETPSDLHLPPSWLNQLLLALTRLENRAIRRWSLPIGTSLFIVARKPVPQSGVDE